MKSVFSLSALFCSLLLLPQAAAQNLLTNGDLDDPGMHEMDLATGWTLTEGPFVPGIPPAPDFDPNSATFATFADHTTEGVPGGVGLWFRAFVGETEDPTDGDEEHQVFANLSQTVPGTPGLPYELSAWSLFENNWPGGVDNLNAAGTDGSDPMDGPLSPTDTFLFLEFLDAGNGVLPGSLDVDLRADGQSNGAGWRQHVLSAVAPAGTASIRVGGSLSDGVINPGVNPQSAFLDDFSLTVVPEPSTAAILLLSCLSLITMRRRPTAAPPCFATSNCNR